MIEFVKQNLIYDLLMTECLSSSDNSHQVVLVRPTIRFKWFSEKGKNVQILAKLDWKCI